MPFFTVSVRRARHGSTTVLADAWLVWWGPDGRREVRLAATSLEHSSAPAKVVLAGALRALSSALDEAAIALGDGDAAEVAGS